MTTQAIPFALPVGAKLLYCNSTQQQGYQTLTVSTAAASGATSITVSSFIPSFAFAPGDQILWLPPAQLSVNDETSSVASWFSAYSVAVRSELMPFRKSFTPSTLLAGGTTTSATLAPQSIVADFLYPGTERLTSTKSLVYYPSPEWRWIDLISDSPIQWLDMSFSWTDNNGNTFPISLQPGETASVLLLFRPRHEHVHTLPRLESTREEQARSAFGGAGGSFALRESTKRKVMDGADDRITATVKFARNR